MPSNTRCYEASRLPQVPPPSYGRCLRSRQNAPYRGTLGVTKATGGLRFPPYVWEMSAVQAKRTIPSNPRCNEALGSPPPYGRHLRSRQHAPYLRTLAVTKPPGGLRFPSLWETSPEQATRTIPSNTHCNKASWRLRFPWLWETSPKQAKRTIPSNTRLYEASWRP